ASLKTIHNQESAEEARAKAQRVVDRWRSLLPEACSVLSEGLEDTLTFYSYPRAHWTPIPRISKRFSPNFVPSSARLLSSSSQG
ncbi:MAG: transposase, partial [Candidatus Methanosuratincola sp.]|nr:transposase [Candidatus Methanosuratincola sp.]